MNKNLVVYYHNSQKLLKMSTNLEIESAKKNHCNNLNKKFFIFLEKILKKYFSKKLKISVTKCREKCENKLPWEEKVSKMARDFFRDI